MEIETEGIVLSSSPSKENDAVLTVLTKNGTIPVFVKGIAKTKNKRLYAQPFSYSAFELKEGKNGMYICSGSTLKEAFYGLRDDIVRLATGQYLLEVSSLVGENSAEADRFLKLLLNALYLLAEKKDIPAERIKLVFEIKFAAVSGFFPEGKNCVKCGKDIAFWSFDEGFLCADCASEEDDRRIFPMSPAMISAVLHILFNDGIRAYSFMMSDDAFSKLSMIAAMYLQYKTEQNFKTENFIRLLNEST